MTIQWLALGNCPDCGLVGGKGRNLCHLSARYPVPRAFCLPANHYTEWLAAGGDESAPLEPSLFTELAAAYAGLAERCGTENPRVAIRSSALDEDGRAASFAGQHETFLNVSGIDYVVEAIVRCWASARTPHALAYRRQRGLSLDAALAVLVQEFIPADASVVAFSINPVTGNRDEVVINANWGLGESIVGGSVTPDTYVVRKTDLGVVERRVTNKGRMSVPAANGTREVVVPRLMRVRPVLNDGQIAEVVRMALSLASTADGPVDVECAYRGDRLFLLQCRPVTALG